MQLPESESYFFCILRCKLFILALTVSLQESNLWFEWVLSDVPGTTSLHWRTLMMSGVNFHEELTTCLLGKHPISVLSHLTLTWFLSSQSLKQTLLLTQFIDGDAALEIKL